MKYYVVFHYPEQEVGVNIDNMFSLTKELRKENRRGVWTDIVNRETDELLAIFNHDLAFIGEELKMIFKDKRG
jgi:hypothetical protein